MGAKTQRVTGGEKKPVKLSLISANSSMPGLGNTYTQMCARQDWHAKSPWHMLARWHPVCSCLARAGKNTHTLGSVTVAIEQGEGQKGGGRREQL